MDIAARVGAIILCRHLWDAKLRLLRETTGCAEAHLTGVTALRDGRAGMWDLARVKGPCVSARMDTMLMSRLLTAKAEATTAKVRTA